MSILGSIGGGMKVYKNKPVDEQYLLSCGWRKVDEDSDDRLVYGVNFINIRYPNIGLVPFGYVLQKDNINAANVERRDGEDLYKSWCLFAKTSGGITTEGEYIDFDAIWEPYSQYRITSVYELEYIMKSKMLC